MQHKKLVLLVLVIFLIFPSQTLAKNGHLGDQELKIMGFGGYELINGNSLFYPFKRLQEKIFSKPQEALFDSRFRELAYIANFRKTGFLEKAVERYNSTAGQIILQDKDKVLRYINILEKLRDGYPANSLPWIQIKQALETTQRLI